MTHEPVWRAFKYFTVVLFGVVGTLTALFAFGTLTGAQPSEAWAIYVTPATAGTLPEDSAVATRDIDIDGFPVVTAEGSPFHTVRCGPVEPVSVVSTRDWFVLGEEGSIDIEQGASTFGPFDASPADTGGDPCGIISFSSVAVPQSVIDRADGRAIKFVLTLRSDGFLPATVASEWFVTDHPVAATTQSDLQVPTQDPRR